MPDEVCFKNLSKFNCKEQTSSKIKCFIVVNSGSVTTFDLVLDEKEDLKVENLVVHYTPEKSFTLRPILIDNYLVVDAILINEGMQR